MRYHRRDVPSIACQLCVVALLVLSASCRGQTPNTPSPVPGSPAPNPSPAPTPDPTPNPPPPDPGPMALTCGAIVSRTIGAAGEVDTLVLHAQAGQAISIALATTGGFSSIPGSAFSAVLTILAPSGSPTVGTLGTNSQATFTLHETGTYTLRVNAGNLSTTGSYNLSVHCLFPVPSPAVVPMTCGGLASRTIDAAAHVDLLTFTGQTGSTVSLALASTGGFATIPGSAFGAGLTIFAPSGATVGITLRTNSQAVLTLPESGTYLVRVSATNLSTTGTYNLSIHCLFPTPSPTAVALGCGSLLPGVINTPAKIDLFIVAGQAGQSVSFALASTGGFASIPGSAFGAAMTLFAPSRATVGSSLSTNSQATFTLSETGTHVARVSATNLSTTGTYNVGLTCP